MRRNLSSAAAILCAVCLLALSLAACSRGGHTDDIPPSNMPSSSVPVGSTEPAEQPSGKQIIRLGEIGVWKDLPDKVAVEFNQQSEEYTVETITYDSVAQLNLGVANGEIDLVSCYYSTLWNYAKKGLLASLNELTPELFQEGVLVKPVVDALRVDGENFFLTQAVSIETFSLPSEDAREFSDIVDFIDCIDAKYPKERNENSFIVLFNILRTYGDYWVDLDKREAYFDSESFRRVLEYADSIVFRTWEDVPEPYLNWDEIPLPLFAFRFSDPETKKEGEPVWVPVAIPGPKSDGVSFDGHPYLGVIKGGNERGAAELLRFMLLEGSLPNDSSIFRPLSIERLTQRLEETDDTSGLPIYSEYDKKVILDTLEKANHVNQLSYDIYNDAIMPEADRFFHGDCTMDEAVARIQSRVSMFLAEIG